MFAAGQDPRFRYNPSMRPEDISPRSSTPSSDSESESESECESEASPSPPRSLSSERELPELVRQRSPVRHCRVVKEGNFTIKEMQDSDIELDSDDAISVVHPDHYEDAESDAPSTQPFPKLGDDCHKLAKVFEKLDFDPSDEREAWVQRQRSIRRKKRLSSGSIHKRKLNESLGSDTDDEDLQPCDLNEVVSSARRLRRRTEDRGSLIFEDPPQRVVELEEPDGDDDVDAMQLGSPTRARHTLGTRATQSTHYLTDIDSDDDDDDE
jgi:hypothetical protein